eukprot:354536-Chlamydomonas_euryale.AAC.4
MNTSYCLPQRPLRIASRNAHFVLPPAMPTSYCLPQCPLRIASRSAHFVSSNSNRPAVDRQQAT